MNKYNTYNIKINPSNFQHPIDKKTTQLIMGQDAFKKALQFISKNSLERQLACIYRSSMAKLTPETAPHIFKMLEEACEMFGVDLMPEVYIQRIYSTEISMLGIETPMILLSTELLKQLDEQMLWGLLASEVSEIRNGFNEIRFVEWICNSTGLLPITITKPLNVLFQNWHKYLRYTYDRANLIATGDFNVTMCSILAGEAPMYVLKKMNFEDPECEYMKQSREFLEKTGHWTEVVRDYKAFADAGVYYAARYMNLYQFAHGDYYDIVEDFQEE